MSLYVGIGIIEGCRILVEEVVDNIIVFFDGKL